MRLIPTAFSDGNGYANRNLLTLSTTTNRYLFPSSDSCLTSWMSISRTSQDRRKLAGIMATRCSLVFFSCSHTRTHTRVHLRPTSVSCTCPGREKLCVPPLGGQTRCEPATSAKTPGAITLGIANLVSSQLGAEYLRRPTDPSSRLSVVCRVLRGDRYSRHSYYALHCRAVHLIYTKPRERERRPINACPSGPRYERRLDVSSGEEGFYGSSPNFSLTKSPVLKPAPGRIS